MPKIKPTNNLILHLDENNFRPQVSVPHPGDLNSTVHVENKLSYFGLIQACRMMLPIVAAVSG